MPSPGPWLDPPAPRVVGATFDTVAVASVPGARWIDWADVPVTLGEIDAGYYTETGVSVTQVAGSFVEWADPAVTPEDPGWGGLVASTLVHNVTAAGDIGFDPGPFPEGAVGFEIEPGEGGDVEVGMHVAGTLIRTGWETHRVDSTIVLGPTPVTNPIGPPWLAGGVLPRASATSWDQAGHLTVGDEIEFDYSTEQVFERMLLTTFPDPLLHAGPAPDTPPHGLTYSSRATAVIVGFEVRALKRFRWLYGSKGAWRLRQRQSLVGTDSWPLRQRQNGGATGSWPLRQRQRGV